MALEWFKVDSGWNGERVVTLVHVRYADEGASEGGLGALVRFMTGALTPGVSLPPPSPAGWYWQGALRRRGVWCRPVGPYPTAEAAMAAADREAAACLV